MARKGRKSTSIEERRASEKRCSEAKATRRKSTLEKYAAKKRAEEGEGTEPNSFAVSDRQKSQGARGLPP